MASIHLAKVSSSIGVNYWLIFEKYVTITSADCWGVKLASIWLGRLMLPDISSPGLAETLFASRIHFIPFLLPLCNILSRAFSPQVLFFD